MTTFARIKDGAVVAVGLPRTGVLADGSTVSHYPALPADVLYAEGWREVEDDGPPDHDPETHFTTRELTVDGDEVVAVYAIHERPPEPEPGPSLEEQVATLKAQNSDLADAVATLTDFVLGGV